MPKVSSTFEGVPLAPEPTADKPVVEDVKPVVATVTKIPGTKPTIPQTDGGKAIPLIDPASQIVPLLPIRATRFTETAPDTGGGATFLSSPAYQYDLGNLVASESIDLSSHKDDRVFVTPVEGWVRYPQEAISPLATKERFPVIIFQHGQHSGDPSYLGYDYLAEELASHGYVVLSIDAEDINNGAGDGDMKGQERAQLILGTLDRLRQIDKAGQVGEDGGAGPLDVLKGKLDFARVGIMGHSRGGQGISNTIKFNQTRVGE